MKLAEWPKRSGRPLRGPESDGEHGEEVIEAVNGVIDAVRKTVGGAGTGVRVGQRGQGEGEQREQKFPVS